MAAPTVAGTTATTSNQSVSASQSLNLPGGITAGETLIMEVAHKAPVGEAAISGWTRFIDNGGIVGDKSTLSIFWKKATGSEGATATFTTTTTTRAASICRRWTGATDPTVTPPEGTAASGTNSNTPNPPAYTMGSAADYMFVAAFAASGGRIASAYPTNYSTNQTTAGPNSGTSTNIGIGSAGRALTAGTTDDPSAFTTTGAGTEEWSVATYVISPTGAGGGPASGSGTVNLPKITLARGKRVHQTDISQLTGEAQNWGLSPHRVVWWNTYKSRWDGIIPLTAPPAAGADDWWIALDIPNDATPHVLVDARANARPDTRWDGPNKKLYVLMAGATGNGRIFSYTYNDVADTYTVSVNNVAVGLDFSGSDTTTVLGLTPNGYLWVAGNDSSVGSPSALGVNRSTDGGATWGTVTVLKTLKAIGKTGITYFTNAGTTYVAIATAENGISVATDDARLHFLYIDQTSAGWSTAGNWTDQTSSVPAYGTQIEADDEISIARDSNENIYIGAETEHIGALSGAGVDPQLILFKRTPGGTWTRTDITYYVTGELTRKRPVITLDDTNSAIYIFANRQDTRITYRSAPLASLGNLTTANEYTIFSNGTDGFRNTHSPEHVTASSGLLVLGDNRTALYPVWELLPIVSAAVNATATPATVAVTTSVPAPTLRSDRTATPAVAAVTTSVPAPVTLAAARPTPGVAAVTTSVQTPSIITAGNAAVPALTVAVSASVPAPTTLAAARPTPGTVAGSVTVPAPVLASNQLTSPGTLAVTTSVPAPAARGAAQPTPLVVASAAAVPGPALAGGAVATPATVAAVAAVPTPSIVLAGSATVSALTVGVSAGVPAPTLNAGALAAPGGAVSGTASVPAPLLSSDRVAAPTTAVVAAAVPPPVTAATARPTPGAAAVSASVPTPTILAGGDVSVGVGTILVATVVPAPVTSGTARTTTGLVAASSSVPVPVLTSDRAATPATVLATAAVPAPVTTGTARSSPAVVAVVAQVQSPTILAGGSVSVSVLTIACTTQVPAPAASSSGLVAPATASILAGVPAPTLRGTAQPTPGTAAVPVVVLQPIVFGGTIGFPVRGPTRKRVLAGRSDAEPLEGAPRAVLVGAGRNEREEA